MKKVVFFFLLVSVLDVPAQNLTLVDSLRRQLQTANDNQKVNLWNAIGFEYRYSFPDSTIYYCNMAYELGRKLELKKELSKPLSFIGLAYNNKGDYQNSISFHLRSIEVALEQEDSVQWAYGYNNLGRMFFDQGDLVRAYDNLIRAKDIFDALQDKSGLAYVYRSLANIHKSQNEYDKALEMSKKAYELRQTVGDFRLIISSLMELGLIQQSAGSTQEALQSFLKADSLSHRLNDPVTKAELSIGLAEIYLTENRLDEAYDRAVAVLKVISESTNQRVFLRATYVQADYFYRKGDYDRAIPLLNKVIQSAERSGVASFQRDASLSLSEIYTRRADKNLAADYKNRYRIFSEMIQNSDLSRQIDRLEFQLEMEKKDKENELLKANEVKNKALLAEQRLENIILIIVIAAVGTIAVIAWRTGRRRREINSQLAMQNSHIYSQREEIAKQNEALSRNNHVLFDLNQEKNTLMNIVAHDLKSPLNRIHGLTNLIEMEGGLTATQQEYLKLVKDSTRSGLDLITDLLDVNALEETRGSAAYADVQIGELLAERVQSLKVAAEEKAIRLDLVSELNETIRSDANYLSRIIDNLLSNAIKFSPRGSQVELKAYRANGSMVLSVKDQGPGFSEVDRKFMFQKFRKLSARPTAGESSNGLGLAIVKTLVDRLSGHIDLKSEPGKGSEFVIHLPLSTNK